MENDCLLRCGKPCTATDSIDLITTNKWDNIKNKSENWKGLDKFGLVYDAVIWQDGQLGRYMHNSCYITLCNTKKLEQAKIRNKKELEDAVTTGQSSAFNTLSGINVSPPKCTKSGGSVHCKEKCV